MMPSEFIGGEKHALVEALEKTGLAKQSLWESCDGGTRMLADHRRGVWEGIWMDTWSIGDIPLFEGHRRNRFYL